MALRSPRRFRRLCKRRRLTGNGERIFGHFMRNRLRGTRPTRRSGAPTTCRRSLTEPKSPTSPNIFQGSHCVSCCFERWRALSERDRAGAAAGRGSRTGRRHNFSIHPLPKSESALLCGGGQNRRRVGRGAASRQGEGRGENSYLESAVTH